MFELDDAATAAALREIALEDEAALDRAIDAATDRAYGRSVAEVETILRARLRHEGLDLGDDVARLAEQIVQTVSQPRPVEPEPYHD